MKTFKEKIKKYSFWTGLSAAMVMLCTSFGKIFGLSIDNQIVEDVIMSVCGVLVALGIVCMPKSSMDNQEQEQINESTQTENDDNKNNE